MSYEKLSDEELRRDIEVQRRGIAEHEERLKLCYWSGGVGALLLVIGLAQYSESAWGLLWMPGALGLAIGVSGYFNEHAGIRRCQSVITMREAVLNDRRK